MTGPHRLDHEPPFIKRWRHALLAFLIGSVAVEIVSGLVIYVGPFTPSLQFTLLFHTIAGLLFVAPWLIYLVSHFLATRGLRSDNRWIGYASVAILGVLVVTGLIQVYLSIRGPERNALVSQIHLIGTFLLIPVIAWHLILAANKVLRSSADQDLSGMFARALTSVTVRALIVFIISLGIVVALVVTYRPPTVTRSVPAEYVTLGEGPFAPSRSMTTTGEFIVPRALGESASCGRCHGQITAEWKSSAHSWSSTDQFYKAIEQLMIRSTSVELTRFCAACHDPIPLLAGDIATPRVQDAVYRLDTPFSDEGVSCLVCHAMKEARTTPIGNGSYVMAIPQRFVYAGRAGVFEKLNDLLIRSYPKGHREAFKRPLQKQAELCGTCHEQKAEPPVSAAPVQLQDQYSTWRKGRFNRPETGKTITCRECHMPLTESTDPARGEPSKLDPVRTSRDGKHRSHRFIAANSIAWAHGDEKQIPLTEAFLKGEQEIPEIADRWTTGPVAPIEIEALSEATPGQSLSLRVTARNNKTGHNFPAGPLDVVQAWIELIVTEGDGRVVYESGTLDDKSYVQGDARVFAEELVDADGAPVKEHELWEVVGKRNVRAIPPGGADVAEYLVPIPEDVRGPVTVKARLRYRKFNQHVMDVVNRYDGTTAPVVDLSADEISIPLTDRSRNP